MKSIIIFYNLKKTMRFANLVVLAMGAVNGIHVSINNVDCSTSYGSGMTFTYDSANPYSNECINYAGTGYKLVYTCGATSGTIEQYSIGDCSSSNPSVITWSAFDTCALPSSGNAPAFKVTDNSACPAASTTTVAIDGATHTTLAATVLAGAALLTQI